MRYWQILMVSGLVQLACERKPQPPAPTAARTPAHEAQGGTTTDQGIEEWTDAEDSSPNSSYGGNNTFADGLSHDEGNLDEALRLTAGERDGRLVFLQAEAAIRRGSLGKGRAFYLLACQRGHIEGCHRYGWHLEQAGNLANARNFYRVACEKGSNKSCNNLGWLSERTGDQDGAKNFYSWACLRRHPGACDNLKRVERPQTLAH